MRPLLFIVGLAFVTTVLIANVDAIKCYFEIAGSELPSGEVDCDEIGAKKGWPKGTFKECGILEATDNTGEKATIRNCLVGPECGSTVDGITFQCTKRCDSDMCNGAKTSTPPAPLLIAVITGVIAAVGI